MLAVKRFFMRGCVVLWLICLLCVGLLAWLVGLVCVFLWVFMLLHLLILVLC